MLALTAFEFIVRTIPEAFIFIFACYAFSNTKVNTKKYIISSILLAICTYFVRMLPINYGVHTILIIIIQTVILTNMNNIDIIKSVKSTIMTVILILIFEGINMLALNLIFKDGLDSMLSNTTLKTIYGLPSLVCVFITILIYYFIKRNGTKNV